VENGLSHEAAIVGAFPVIAGALVQRAKGGEPVAPDPAASHAADTLSMMLGRKPDAREVAALDAYLVTVCDHGMNASTFTTRVVASTQADLFAAVTAGYCALTGPLHGGAPEPVLEMLDAIGTAERIEPWVDSALARGDRLMGFGHRIYRVRDPRADVLKGAIERLAGDGTDLPFAGEVEAYIRAALRRKNPDRPLDTNVEFFTAILLDALTIPRQAFTPIFAGGPRHRMDRARPRAAANRPADPAKFSLYRPDAGLRQRLDDNMRAQRLSMRRPGLHASSRRTRL
jgi:citrate synthase